MGTKETNNSFHSFQTSIEDVWDTAPDDFKFVAQKTAQQVIDNHRSSEQKKSTEAPAVKSLNSKRPPSIQNHISSSAASRGRSASSDSRHSNTPVTPSIKTAPGMGIRLNPNCSQPAFNPPQRQKIDQQRLQKFRTLINSPMTNLDELRSLSWSGIPQEVRPVVWKLLCDYLPPSLDRREAMIDGKRIQYFGFIDQYFHRREGGKMNTEMFHQIQKDLTRMNTLHKKPEMQKLFERVLFIWSMRHPASGYVQGINDLLTPYFIVFLSEFVNVDLNTAGELTLGSEPTEEELRSVEADCFWCVSRLLDSIQDHYTFAQPGIQANVTALAKLIERLDAELDSHIKGQKVEYLQFAFRWMNNLLMRELPLRCILRLWDTYQAEKDGFSHFHLYVCAAFLLRFTKELKRERDFQGIILMLQNLPTYHWTDEEINVLLAESYRLQTLFAQAPKHLNKVN